MAPPQSPPSVLKLYGEEVMQPSPVPPRPMGSLPPRPLAKSFSCQSLPSRATFPRQVIAAKKERGVLSDVIVAASVSQEEKICGRVSKESAVHQQQVNPQERMYDMLQKRVADLEERASQHETATETVGKQLCTTITHFQCFTNRLKPVMLTMHEKLQGAASNVSTQYGNEEDVSSTITEEAPNHNDLSSLEDDFGNKILMALDEGSPIKQHSLFPCCTKSDDFMQELARHGELILNQESLQQEVSREIAKLQEEVIFLRQQSLGPCDSNDSVLMQKASRDGDFLVLHKGLQNAISSLQEEVRFLKQASLGPCIAKVESLIQEAVRHDDFVSVHNGMQQSLELLQDEVRCLKQQNSGPCDAHTQSAFRDVAFHSYCAPPQHSKKHCPSLCHVVHSPKRQRSDTAESEQGLYAQSDTLPVFFLSSPDQEKSTPKNESSERLLLPVKSRRAATPIGNLPSSPTYARRLSPPVSVDGSRAIRRSVPERRSVKKDLSPSRIVRVLSEEEFDTRQIDSKPRQDGAGPLAIRGSSQEVQLQQLCTSFLDATVALAQVLSSTPNTNLVSKPASSERRDHPCVGA